MIWNEDEIEDMDDGYLPPKYLDRLLYRADHHTEQGFV